MEKQELRDEVRERLNHYIVDSMNGKSIRLDNLSIDVTNLIQEFKAEGVVVCCDYTGAAIEGIQISALPDGTLDFNLIGGN